MQVAIVGAGIAGLVAARALQGHGHQVALVDKGKGVGGRLATRRVGGAVCDHGAQFFTIRSPEFQKVIADIADAVVPWGDGFVDAHGQLPDGLRYPRYRGRTGMTGLAKALASGLACRLDTPVARVEQVGKSWRLALGNGGGELLVDAVVLTCPVPQSLALLEPPGAASNAGTMAQPPAGAAAGAHALAGPTATADHAALAPLLPGGLHAHLAALLYEPCFALMAVLSAPSAVPDPGAVRPDSPILAFVADNARKGISPLPALTLYSTAAFARAHFDADPEVVTAALLQAAAPWLRGAVLATSLQRWRYATPVGKSSGLFAQAGTLAFAGDAFAGGRVEGAALSGLAVAAALAKVLA